MKNILFSIIVIILSSVQASAQAPFVDNSSTSSLEKNDVPVGAKVENEESKASKVEHSFFKKPPVIQVDLLGQWNFYPSTVSNESEFLVSKVQIENRWTLTEQIKMTLGAQWQSAGKSDLDQKGTFSFSKAFLFLPLNFNHSESQSYWVKYGLIPSLWRQISEDAWQFKDSGSLFSDVFSKYKYESEKDLGVAFQGCLENLFFEFSIMNGEGARTREYSGKKEISVLTQIQWTEHFSMLIQYIKGSYDQYAADVQGRERLKTALIYENEKNQVFVEYGKTKDPADALSLLGMASGFDAVTFAGQSLSGELISFRYSYRLNAMSKTMLQLDQVTPNLEKSNLVLKSATAGVNYKMTSELNWTLAFSETNRSAHYGLGAEKDQFLRLTTQLIF